MDVLVTAAEAAKILGIRRDNVSRAMKLRGKQPAVSGRHMVGHLWKLEDVLEVRRRAATGRKRGGETAARQAQMRAPHSRPEASEAGAVAWTRIMSDARRRFHQQLRAAGLPQLPPSVLAQRIVNYAHDKRSNEHDSPPSSTAPEAQTAASETAAGH